MNSNTATEQITQHYTATAQHHNSSWSAEQELKCQTAQADMRKGTCGVPTTRQAAAQLLAYKQSCALGAALALCLVPHPRGKGWLATQAHTLQLSSWHQCCSCGLGRKPVGYLQQP